MQSGEATAMRSDQFMYEDPSGRELPPKGTIGAPVAKGKPPAVVTLGPSVPSESFLDYFSVGGWILIFALALIVIWGGGALWFVFKPRPESSTTPEQEKDFFDRKIEEQIAAEKCRGRYVGLDREVLAPADAFRDGKEVDPKVYIPFDA